MTARQLQSCDLGSMIITRICSRLTAFTNGELKMKNKYRPEKLQNFIDIKKGEYITRDKENEGIYPVILGGKEPAYYIDRYNHDGKAIVVSRSGASAGYVSLWNEKIFVTGGFLIEPKNNVSYDYIYYFLKSREGILKLLQGGAAIPHVTPRLLNNLQINLPPLPTQQKIASILSAYDRLIQNYKKQIEALQTAASELYKEWFVRFRFPGYQTTRFENGIPEGWKVEKVKNCVNRLPFGQTYKKDELEPEGNVIVIDQSEDEYLGYHNNEPSHTASPENPIALFGDHSCKYKLMIKDFSLGENIIPYISKGVDLYYLYYSVYKIVQTEEYKRHWNLFVNKKILIPNTELQKSFRQKVIPIFKQIEILNKQIANLTQQCDLLLPRLMSGKLEVK